MLSPVRTRWLTLLAGFIVSLTVLSVVIGLTSPDGDVDAPATPSPSAPATPPADEEPAEPGATPTPDPADPPDERAPEQTRGLWPGLPAGVAVDETRVRWCTGVTTDATPAARQVFGDEAVTDTACAAVELLFTHRYSRLAVPTTGYTVADFEALGDALTPSTWSNVYLPRVQRLVSNPDDPAARRDLGVMLFRGTGTPSDAAHASAGQGRVFYGEAFTTDGYDDRAVWINPRWSDVRASVDLAQVQPRLRIDLEASAAVPVWDPASGQHEMLTVPTTATLYYLVTDGKEGGRALVDSWQLTTGRYVYTPLTVH